MDNTCVRFHAKTDRDRYWVSIENNPATNTATNCGRSIICGPQQQGGGQYSSIGPPCANAEWLVHEFGHALCFGHEHQRQDSDKYIYLDTNVNGCNRYNYPLLYAPDWSTQNLPFDFNSIMLYAGCRRGQCIQRQPTQQGTGPCGEAGDGSGRLSPTDIRRVNLFYGCDCTIYRC